MNIFDIDRFYNRGNGGEIIKFCYFIFIKIYIFRIESLRGYILNVYNFT